MADMNFGKMRQDAMTVLEGEFVVRCVEATNTKNSKGDDMIKCKFEIIAGPFAGRRVSNNFNIIPSNPNALKMFFAHMGHLGLDVAYFDRLPNGEAGVAQITRDLVGRVATAKLGKRTWNGVDSENIESWAPAPAGMGGVGLPTVSATALPTTLPTAMPVTEAIQEPDTVVGAAGVTLPMTVGDPTNIPSAGGGVENEAARSEEPKLPF